MCAASLISAAVSLIMAQRLARANCKDCLVEDTSISREMLIRIGFAKKKSTGRPIKARMRLRRFRISRRGIYEVLRINPELEEAILRNALARIA